MDNKNNRFALAIEIDEQGSQFKAQGKLNAGMVKMLIGELEYIKMKLLADLEKSIDNNSPTERHEFN